jgi:hypothetical protein
MPQSFFRADLPGKGSWYSAPEVSCWLRFLRLPASLADDRDDIVVTAKSRASVACDGSSGGGGYERSAKKSRKNLKYVSELERKRQEGLLS